MTIRSQTSLCIHIKPGFPLTWKVGELIWSGNFVGGQGMLVACKRKGRFLSTFQGKVAIR